MPGLDDLSFSLYGGPDSVKLPVLLSQNEGLLFARAENSGCEGCYVEVAKWNDAETAWQRFAFCKLFGEEIAGYLTAESVAGHVAMIINNHSDAAYANIIHRMPDWGSPGWKRLTEGLKAIRQASEAPETAKWRLVCIKDHARLALNERT